MGERFSLPIGWSPDWYFLMPGNGLEWTTDEDENSSDCCEPQAHFSPPPEPSSEPAIAGSGEQPAKSSPPPPSSSPPVATGWNVPSLPPESEPLTASLKSTDVCAFNTRAERRFVEILAVWLEDHPEGLDRAFVVRNMAFALDVSTRTIERYLAKYTAELSPWFVEVAGIIRRKGA